MNELLPIGTIVKPKNTADFVKVMIIGYYPVDNEAEEMYEYSGVLYPQGILGEKSILLFNSMDIQEMVFDGFSDEESNDLREALPLLISRIAEKAGEE